MSSLSIRTFPDPILRKVCTPVRRIDRSTKAFIDRLIETLYRQPGGIGIAAPQVGVCKRIAIVDLSSKEPSAQRLVLINPVLLKGEGHRLFREGCMSLSDYTANVHRHEKVHVKWLGLDKQNHELSANGIEAICIQHEIDHLNGILFVDRVASLKTDVFRRRRYL